MRKPRRSPRIEQSRHSAEAAVTSQDRITVGKPSSPQSFTTTCAFVTLGDFFGSYTTDMLLRTSSTGGFEVYDISSNNITGAAFLGAVGLDWQVLGFGNFSSSTPDFHSILEAWEQKRETTYDAA